MKMPLVGPSYEARSVEENSRKLINMFLVQDPYNDVYPLVAYPSPGTSVFSANTGQSVRALFSQNNVLYAVIDDGFYSIDKTGSKTLLGNLNTSAGVCYVVGTNLEIMVSDKTDGWIYALDTGTFTQITASAFSSSSKTIEAQDSYFIAHVGQQFNISGLLDGLTWNGLDFASAEGDPDDIQAIKSFQRRLFLMGNKSTEIWFNTGATEFPFSRVEGIYIDYGIAAVDSAAVGDSAIYFLAVGKNGQIGVLAVNESFNDEIISTQALNSEFLIYNNINDARGWVYQQEGKEFYVLTFPSENKTWVYDTKLGVWHERTSTKDGIQGRHVMNCIAEFDSDILIGDYSSGNIYKLDPKAYTDNGEEIIRTIRTSPIMNDARRLFVNRIEVDFDNAAALVSGQGVNPQAMLRLSKDGGFTWGSWQYRSIGKIGEYGIRALWNRLGSGRRIVVELQLSDPVEWIVLGAYMDAKVGRE